MRMLSYEERFKIAVALSFYSKYIRTNSKSEALARRYDEIQAKLGRELALTEDGRISLGVK